MRPFHTLAAVVLGVLCVVATLDGCGGNKVCNPACTGGATCVDGQCVSNCNPATCGYDGICFDGGCVRAHPPAVNCPPPTLIAGGTVGPASPPASCQKSVRPTAHPAAQVQELGVHPVGQTVTFNVPANSTSLTVVSQAVRAWDTIVFEGNTYGNSVVPDKLRDPSGTVWYDDNVFPPDLEQAYAEYAGNSPVINSFTIPSTSKAISILRDGGVPPGSWSFLVNDYAYECTYLSGCDGGTDAGEYDIKVLTQSGPSSSAGTLDLSIYLVETSGLDSGTALTSPSVQRYVQSTTTLFAQQGICPGRITFYDVPAWATARYATSINADRTEPCDLMPQMFTLSQSDSTLNLFWVSFISGGSGGGTVLGIDGTIPGPSTVGGTIASGASVSIDDLTSGSCGNSLSPLTCGADEIAYITAHEAGHWLGLFHTTEAPGIFFDPLSDTPKCVCRTCLSQTGGCASGSALVSTSQCNNSRPDCGGSDNLMFWLLGGQAGGKLTPDQGEVMRRNLVVHQ